jgi:hypothetical protein
MDAKNQHPPRVDEELATASDAVTFSAGVTRDDVPESAPLTAREVRERSDLGVHLRPSVFPATRAALVACAREEDAPQDLVTRLRSLPDTTYDTVEQVWEALGGRRETRGEAEGEAADANAGVSGETSTAGVSAPEREWSGATPSDRPEPSETRCFGFAFDRRYRIGALIFGVHESHAYVEIEGIGPDGDVADATLRARFGLWVVETPVSNVETTTITGPYDVVKTIGPAHLSLVDRGLTFATNPNRGLCISFRTPVHGIDPLGKIRHPGLTVTVADVDGLRDALSNGSS